PLQRPVANIHFLEVHFSPATLPGTAKLLPTLLLSSKLSPIQHHDFCAGSPLFRGGRGTGFMRATASRSMNVIARAAIHPHSLQFSRASVQAFPCCRRY